MTLQKQKRIGTKITRAPNRQGKNPMIEYIRDRTRKNKNFLCVWVGETGCLSGDTLISTKSGGFKPIKDIKIGEKVRVSGGFINKKVTNKFEYDNQQIYKITTETGKILKATKKHNILTDEGFKKVEELKTNDKIKVMNMLRLTKKKAINNLFNKEKAKLYGYALADGHRGKYAITLYVAEDEIELRDKLKKIIINEFNEKPSIYVKKLGKGRTVPITIVEINSKEISEKLSFLSKKRIPLEIMNSPNDVVSNYLKWLYTGDGCIISKGRGKRGIFYSANLERVDLLRDIQLLLLRFEIHSRINGRNLLIRRGESILKFAKYIGIETNKKQKRLKHLVEYAKVSKRRHKKVFEKIIKIEKLKKEKVYDITVEKVNRYIANGIVVHNSGKTYSALGFAHALDPRFTADDVVFTVQDFFNLLAKYQRLYSINPRLVRGRVIIFDEAGVGVNNRQWASFANKAVSAVMQSFRYMNLIVIFTTPDMTFIDKAARKLFHGYFETIKGGIDFKRKIAYSKYFVFVRNLYKGTEFPMYLRIKDKETNSMKRLTRVGFRMPPQWLIDDYEEKRHSWASAKYSKLTKGIALSLDGIKVSMANDGQMRVKRKGKVDYFEVKKTFMKEPGIYLKNMRNGSLRIDTPMLLGTGKWKGASAALKLAVKKMYYDKDVQEIFKRVKAGEIPLVKF